MLDNRDSLDFSKEPVTTLFRKMFIPTLVGMVSMVILNITDGAFVGHGAGSDALAAINIVAPIFLISNGLGLMFGIGSSVVASIHLSKGNEHAANLNLTQGVCASVIVGLLLTILFSCFRREVCMLFGCSEVLLPLAISYLKWVAFLAPFNMFGMAAMFMVRLDGAPRFAMIINCAMAILNILLDYILIYPCHMGIEGAAIATTISFALGSIPLLIFLLRYTHSVHFYRIKLSFTSLRLTLRNIGYQIRIGFSALLGECAIAFVMVIGNYIFIYYLGEDGVAAYSVACYCSPIVFMMGNAIVESVQPILSFAHGVGNYSRLLKAISLALRISFVSGLLGMLIMWIGADFISSIFLPSSCHAYTLCSEGLPYFSPAFLIISINVVLVGFLQSVEEARLATLFTFLRGVVFTLPSFIFLPMLIGMVGLWFALPLAEFVTLLIMIIYFLLKKS